MSEKKSTTPKTGIREKKSTDKSAQKKSAKKELISVAIFSLFPTTFTFKSYSDASTVV